MENESKIIVFFDGVCNLCNHFVQFILKNEAHSEIYFSSLQSQYSKEFLNQFQWNKHSYILKFIENDFQSVYFYKNGTLYDQSDAALAICTELKNPYKFLSCLKVVPKGFRDKIYSIIAKNRYKIYGKKDECWLPKPELKHRFLV